MKQVIVLMSSIVLGIFIYGLIVGPGDHAVLSSLKDLWETGLIERSPYLT